jgi:hypothetical protein
LIFSLQLQTVSITNRLNFQKLHLISDSGFLQAYLSSSTQALASGEYLVALRGTGNLFPP